MLIYLSHTYIVIYFQNDANAQELAALKAVIKCVEGYKLESDYPLDPLQRRVAQLDKLKTDRKRIGESSKRQSQPKKPKASRGYFGFRPSGGSVGRQRPPARASYPGIPDRFPHVGPISYDYQVPGQASLYVQQANEQRLPYYPHDDRIAAPSSYGNYMGGSSLQSSHKPYM